MYYDTELDDQCGYRDALMGLPHASTQFGYRTGYDRGLAEAITRDNLIVTVRIEGGGTATMSAALARALGLMPI